MHARARQFVSWGPSESTGWVGRSRIFGLQVSLKLILFNVVLMSSFGNYYVTHNATLLLVINEQFPYQVLIPCQHLS